jgi:RP/EB family microtubule-associated protein
MQDNLDFLQFSKRYWDQYYPGGEYDAIARRKGSGAPPAANAGAPRAAATSAAARRPVGGAGLAGRARTPQGGAGNAALHQENAVLKETVTGLERERDFYFSKLRDIELMIQQAFEENPDVEKDENNILKQIQLILYSTEVCLPALSSPLNTNISLQEGFEIPEGEQEELVEEETF